MDSRVASFWIGLACAACLGVPGCSSESTTAPVDPRLEMSLRWSAGAGTLLDGTMRLRADAPDADTLRFDRSVEDGASDASWTVSLPPGAEYAIDVRIEGRLQRTGGTTGDGTLLSADTTLVDLRELDVVSFDLRLSGVVPVPRLAAEDDTLELSWDPIPDAIAYEIRREDELGHVSLEQVVETSFDVPFPPTRLPGSDPSTPRPDPRIASGKFELSRRAAETFSVRARFEGGSGSAYSEAVSFDFPDPVPPAAVEDLAADEPMTERSIRLTWTAPGDDGFEGRAAKYDLRFRRDSIDESTFPTAQSYRIGLPGPAGGAETIDVLGLEPGTTYGFALRTADEGEHWSELSNTVVATTALFLDSLPPLPVDDLAATASQETSLDLTWTAPSDDDGDTVDRYEIRYSDTPIDIATFPMATLVADAPVPSPPGSEESLRIGDLFPEVEYFIALRSRDLEGNLSPMSNVASVMTPDNTSPAAVTDLAARGDPPTITWTAPGDNGSIGVAAEYDLRIAAEPITESTFNFAEEIEGEPVPSEGGTLESFPLDPDTVWPEGAGDVAYLALKTRDDGGNISLLSNVIQLTRR